MITITGLSKSFGDRRVLDGLDLQAKAGEVTLIVGTNGCGKTTTLRHLCGLSAPDTGQITIGAADLTRDRMAALGQLSFLPQSPRFHARLTVAEILAFYARLRGLPLARAVRVEQQWDLVSVRGQSTGKLSGGTRQRLALAVLALPDAPVLILDEPGLSLDPHWRRFLQAELHTAARRGATVLVATHLLGEWNGQADRCLVLEGGRIGRELPPSQLIDAFPFSLRVGPHSQALSGGASRRPRAAGALLDVNRRTRARLFEELICRPESESPRSTPPFGGRLRSSASTASCTST